LKARFLLAGEKFIVYFSDIGLDMYPGGESFESPLEYNHLE
jgi:hypothetical protein